MLEPSSRITDNEMSKPDSFFDALLESLLDSLPGPTASEVEGLEGQNAEMISEMIFSESSETVESMSVENHNSPPGSESAPTATVSESETEPPEDEENVFALTEQIDPLSATFFVGLASEIRSSLSKTKEYARFSEKNLTDSGSTEYFCQIANDIEKIEELLDVYVKFHKISTPPRKANTVHTIIEKVLKKHEDKFKEKNVMVFRKFEDDLPEIIVHDRQLEYILNHLIQYMIGLISPNGGIGLFTSSRDHNEKVAEGQQTISDKDSQYVYISLVLAGCKGPASQFGKKVRIQDQQPGEMLFGLRMRFVEETVRKNQGMLKIEVDEEKKKTFFIMRFPVERRQVVCYDLEDE